jgi:uncharacterized protein YjbJ (UPF0337 family)
MDHNRVEGTKHQVKGAAKEMAGKITGDKWREATGAMEKNAGKIQRKAGKAKDDAEREAGRRH